MVALGMFDGLHLGHQAVLQQALALAQQTPPTQPKPTVGVVTFATHPKAFFDPSPSSSYRQLLTPPPEKLAWLAHLGLDFCWMPPFDATLATQTAHQFEAETLARLLHAKHVLTGQDFGYGQGRQGNVATLSASGQRFGWQHHPVQLLTSPALLSPAQKIGSGSVRQALANNQFTLATQLLGRPYSWQGVVQAGQGLAGSVLGLPTANFTVAADKLMPPYGVSVGWAEVSFPHESAPLRRPALCNWGIKPTLANASPTPLAEVHLLHAPQGMGQGTLVGQPLRYWAMAALRPEQRFATLEALRQQCHQDAAQAYTWAASTLEPAWEQLPPWQ
jgi:riboflavin kinase/FMN adenylyltransferase